jgi:hypothetical protein
MIMNVNQPNLPDPSEECASEAEDDTSSNEVNSKLIDFNPT